MKKVILLVLLFSFDSFANSGVMGSGRYEILTGKTKSRDASKNWDQLYSQATYVYGKKPAKFLAENYHYIPQASKVLDMGMGEGRNAVFLALKGYKVTGVDMSVVGVKKARKLAREFGVRFDAITSKMEDYDAGPEVFDAIIVFYYVDRTLNKKIMKMLKKGGILIYEAHTLKQRSIKGSETYDPKFLLNESELLTMYKGFRVLKYEEPIHKGDYTASIILQKK